MLDPKIRELIAIGSSVAAKCQPCLKHHLQEAQKAGASPSEVRHAVGIARMVRKAGDQNMDAFTDEKVGGRTPELRGSSACCGSDGGEIRTDRQKGESP